MLVAEINVNIPDRAITPPPEVADDAVDVALNGKRNKICVATQQSVTTMTTTSQRTSRRWSRTAGAIVVGLVGIVGVLFAPMQAQGWSF